LNNIRLGVFLMIKKILKWLFIVVTLLILLIILGYNIFVNWFAKDFIESQIEKQVNRDVEIGDLYLKIFSAEPVIKIHNLLIANQLLSEQKQTLKTDPFVKIDTIKLLLKFPPLLKRQVQIEALLVKSLDIHAIRYANGQFNFSDLLKSKNNAKQEKKPQAQTEAKKVKTDTKKQKKQESPDKPEKQDKPKQFCADDLPVQILVGQLGIEKAHIQVYDQEYNQLIHINELDVLFKDININPNNLEKENIIRFDSNMNVKAQGKLKSGWAKSFDFDLMLEAEIHPFNSKTRLLDPQAKIKTGSPIGTVSGLQAYEAIRSELLNFKLTQLDFLKKELNWRKGVVNLIANQNQVELNEGIFKVDNMVIKLDGKYMIHEKSVDIALDILLPDEQKQKIEHSIQSFIEKQIPSRHRSYVNINEIRNNILDAILAKDGNIHLIFALFGPAKKPDMRLLQPQLPAIDSIVADTLKDIKNQLINQAKTKANKEIDRMKQKAKKKIDKFNQKAQKELDRLPDGEAKDTLDTLKDKVFDILPFSF